MAERLGQDLGVLGFTVVAVPLVNDLPEADPVLIQSGYLRLIFLPEIGLCHRFFNVFEFVLLIVQVKDDLLARQADS